MAPTMVEKNAAPMINGRSVTSLATTVAVTCRGDQGRGPHVPGGRPPGDEPQGGAGRRQRHGGEQRAEQPWQRQMDVARGKTAGDAGGERRGDRERRGEALRQALEDGR